MDIVAAQLILKDVVEKVFSNIKERLNMLRMLASSERSLEGKE